MRKMEKKQKPKKSEELMATQIVSQEEDETVRIESELNSPGTPPKSVYILIVMLIIAILVMAYFLFFGESKASNGDSQNPKVKQMQEMVGKIRTLEQEINTKQNEVFSLLGQYKDKTGQDLPHANMLDLTEEQRKVLEEKVRNEADVSIKSLLSDILEKNQEINELKVRISEVEALLPKPAIVQHGENHYSIAMNFLMNEKGLDKEKAMELIERSALFDTLMPGFKVWNFYSGEDYGTFVTQGDAPISPNEVNRRAKKKLIDAKDQAIAEKNQLAGEITTLEEKKKEIIGQLDLLAQEKQNLLTKMSELSTENIEMQDQINSLYFLAQKRKDLKDQKIIRGGFLKSTKLDTIDPELFKDYIDLRQTQQIVLFANTFDVRTFSKISLYPKFYKENVDYKIIFEEENQKAIIEILNPEKMKAERIVISIN